MADLSTTYMGLALRNPIIVGSSGLTGSVKGVQELEGSGAGAVVLKSIFEEEIVYEMDDVLKEAAAKGLNMDQFDYLTNTRPSSGDASKPCRFRSSQASTAPFPTSGPTMRRTFRPRVRMPSS
jgi:hypothetical protein